MMEGIYSRTWYLGEERESRKCQEGSSQVQEEAECKSKVTRKIRYNGRKEL